MTIVHSEAPWGHSQEERLAPKERTHPMRPLSCNNNTTTRLKRGPNPLSGVLILILIFVVVVVVVVFFFFGIFYFVFFGIVFFCIIYFCIFLFLYLFLYFVFLFCIYLFIYFLYFFFCILYFYFFYICAYMLSPWGQPQQTIKSQGYREVLILSLGS